MTSESCSVSYSKHLYLAKLESRRALTQNGLVLHHLRDKDGYEVDIVVQRRTHHAGIEVKAASSVRESDFRGLNACAKCWASLPQWNRTI